MLFRSFKCITRMVRHNNVVPNVHLHKHWNPTASQNGHVRTFFNQAGKKRTRRATRVAKAVHVFPKPVSGNVRPVVQAFTHRYNMKARAGRGFTPAEVVAAGNTVKQVRCIGVAVDKRRHNYSEEAFQRNVDRLKQYLNKVVVLPRHPKKGEKSDAVNVSGLGAGASGCTSSKGTVVEGAFKHLRELRLSGIRERVRAKKAAKKTKKK